MQGVGVASTAPQTPRAGSKMAVSEIQKYFSVIDPSYRVNLWEPCPSMRVTDLKRTARSKAQSNLEPGASDEVVTP